MSVSGFRPEVASRPGIASSEMGSSVLGWMSIMVNPSRPPHRATIRPFESKVIVAHSRTP